MTVLVVDDEPTLVETVGAKLRREGYSVVATDTAEAALRLFRQSKPDLLILDVMLPNRSGFDLCRAIRTESRVPIIFLTARASEADRVAGLEIGADDYIVKPFSLGELAARVKAVLRRAQAAEPEASGPVESGDLRIDPRSHTATLGDEPISLPKKEFALLLFFASHPGQAFTRATLLDRIWGEDAFVSERTVDVHVRWLRERIEKDPSHPERLLTVRGVGYKFAG